MRILGLDPGETVGLALIDWHGDSVAIVKTARIGAPTSTKLRAEEAVELERRFRAKIAQEIGALAPDLVVVENPIDARAYWLTKTARGGRPARRESPETRYGQGVNFATAVHAVPENVKVVAYPVRGRKGLPGWQGSRMAKAILETMRLALRTAGLDPDVSEHELMALGLALYHLDKTRLERFRDEALRGAHAHPENPDAVQV